jgi:hypothetical protein
VCRVAEKRSDRNRDNVGEIWARRDVSRRVSRKEAGMMLSFGKRLSGALLFCENGKGLVDIGGVCACGRDIGCMDKGDEGFEWEKKYG